MLPVPQIYKAREFYLKGAFYGREKNICVKRVGVRGLDSK